jgi:hypothetical protein
MSALQWSCFTRAPDWLHLIIINSFIALQLTLTTNGGFVHNLLYSQAIGLSVASSLVLMSRAFKLAEPKWWTYLIAVPLGVMIGLTLASAITGQAVDSVGTGDNSDALRGILFSVLTGAAVTWYFFVRDHRLRGRISLAEQNARLTEQQRQLTETQLLLLQAQVEPHFLFNTLANVAGLIEHRPADARHMLESFTTYLRGSLMRTRVKTSKVSDEIELLEAYLAVQKIRMGERLTYEFSVDASCESLPLAPLLIQPLVENALTHGLEPKLDGGSISISINRSNNILKCSVVDTGVGFTGSQASAGSGLGLNNVRQRLASLYGDSAALKVLEPSSGNGVSAELEIPLDRLQATAP